MAKKTLRIEEKPSDAAVGTVVLKVKDAQDVTANVTEVYPHATLGAEPWEGAGSGFFAGGGYHRMADEGKAWEKLVLFSAPAGSKYAKPVSGPVEVQQKDVRSLELQLAVPGETVERMKLPALPDEPRGVATDEGDAEKFDAMESGRYPGQLAAPARHPAESDEQHRVQRVAEIDKIRHGLGEDLEEAIATVAAGMSDSAGSFFKREPVADCAPIDQLEVPTVDSVEKPPRPTLEVAIERYGNIDRDMQKFLGRLDSWIVEASCETGAHDGHVAICSELRDAWEVLGKHLSYLEKIHATVKVTAKSRRDAWMRPGVQVALSEEALPRFAAYYSAEVLENLTIRHAGEDVAFLVSGERELGLVPKSQIVKRQNGNVDASSAK